MPFDPDLTPLEPIKIKCTDTDCENDLHCFRATNELRDLNRQGECRDCGANLVDWNRIENKDLSDVEFTFNSLTYELIRHHFFHVEIDQRSINYALRKGKVGMLQAVENRLRKSIGEATPYRDGQQTPFEGNPIYYAQHATATCCRTCIEEWYGIPKGVPIQDEDISYFTELIMEYIQKRIPTLSEEGIHVPPIRKKT
ncbi:DUF4186 family protein [Bacillus hwajinpoensis]|uniref:DUF4186 family protein n=1 Tax=Guptibacillus hwajinpoensis TaxID=208199 RepID=A0A845F5V8_9BACL|nr:DUF4186 family protein [Pseudalkalibacillus hwajinpoensis]MYL65987.1 DUF4186 family protein [Pseudalkalibacillus hwajinpoensis]